MKDPVCGQDLVLFSITRNNNQDNPAELIFEVKSKLNL